MTLCVILADTVSKRAVTDQRYTVSYYTMKQKCLLARAFLRSRQYRVRAKHGRGVSPVMFIVPINSLEDIITYRRLFVNPIKFTERYFQ